MSDFFTILHGILVLITAIVAMVTAWLSLKNKSSIKSARSAINEIHILVNNRSEIQDRRIEQLTKVIRESAGVEVPDRPFKEAA